MQQKEIGMQISAARKKLKYTQRELAEKLGVSDKTISKWERWRRLSGHFLASAAVQGAWHRGFPAARG